MKQCPDCSDIYGRGYEVTVACEPCGKCEEGAEDREVIL
jgi:hypothetical protein